MAGVDKIPLKPISTWILGYQSERNEVKHTLDQISLPKKSKPKEEEIMTLRKGHFYLSSYNGVKKVYVQPAWLDDETAIKVSKGKLDIEKIQAPENLVPYSQQSPIQDSKVEIRFDDSTIRKDLIELRQDFFNKIEDLQTFEQKLASELYNLKSTSQHINEDEIISKVLQKLPSQNINLNREELIKDILLSVPKSMGNVVYEIAPLEKIKKDFLQEVKNKILSDIGTLSSDEKKALKYLESRNVDIAPSELVIKCFLLKQGGSSSTKISNILKSLFGVESVEKTSGGRYRGRLKEKIKFLLGTHGATDQEIENVYNHILMEMLK